MTQAFVSGLLAGYGVAIPVGAIGVLIIGLSARASVWFGVGAALGVATADGLYALIAVLGGAAIATVIEPIATPLKIVAAVVLIAIALRVAVTALRHRAEPSRAVVVPRLATPLRAYVALVGLTLLNPATVIYFAALVLGHRAAGVSGSGSQEVVFVAAAFIASASWQLLLAGGGAALGRTLSGPRGQLATALASSALIVILAAVTILS